MEEDTKKVMPPSEMQKIREREAHETIAKAQRAMMEDKDEVKRMNQMILFAKCMAVRDEQVQGEGREGFVGGRMTRLLQSQSSWLGGRVPGWQELCRFCHVASSDAHPPHFWPTSEYICS